MKEKVISFKNDYLDSSGGLIHMRMDFMVMVGAAHMKKH